MEAKQRKNVIFGRISRFLTGARDDGGERRWLTRYITITYAGCTGPGEPRLQNIRYSTIQGTLYVILEMTGAIAAFLLFASGVSSAAAAAAAAPLLPRIAVSPPGFVADGKPFVPRGANYIRLNASQGTVPPHLPFDL